MSKTKRVQNGPNQKNHGAKPKNQRLSRRGFLKTGVGTGAATAMTSLGAASSATAMPEHGLGPDVGIDTPLTSDSREAQNHQRRVEMSRTYLNQTLRQEPQLRNDDEERYKEERYYASFTKTLPCNDLGEVEPEAFEQLLIAVESQSPEDFDRIPRSFMAAYRLENPQGALKFQSCGIDGHGVRMPPSHAFSSAKLAGEMVELYWQAQLRDLPFEQYSNENIVQEALADLNQLQVTPGQIDDAPTSAQTLFRGETAGDRVGPYVSQFLWKDFNFGPVEVVQRYTMPTPGLDFMTDVNNWLLIQLGAMPNQAATYSQDKRYIFNNRTLASFVHKDVSFQAYLHAALIAMSYGRSALDSSNPYLDQENQGAFVSHGAPFILDLVTRAAQAALHAAWYQKWSVHRLLRPEALAARVHFHYNLKAYYDLHDDLLSASVLDRVEEKQNNFFLAQAYPEGSPTHPSYPAGHACVAGACVTVLKALFNEQFEIPDPVVARNEGRDVQPYTGSVLTLGGELNKLASNISLGRDAAGVHYRQDGVQGLLVGEQVAIALLSEASTSCNEGNFDGYHFRDFFGDSVHIQDGDIVD